ncbi:MAG: hypothetical protein Q9221_000220 [Calogaya cf. arnoldii]
MISKPTSRPRRLASSIVLFLTQGLTLAQETIPKPSSTSTTRLHQFGIAADCNAFIVAKPGDICFDTAANYKITLEQLAMWNPVLGPNGKDCPTQFLAEYEYCVGVSGIPDAGETPDVGGTPRISMIASPGPFTLNATNDTVSPFQNGAGIAATNGSFYIGVDALVTCQDCPNNGYLFSVSDDSCATVSPISGPEKMFVSTSTGALGYGDEEEEEKEGERKERMEKGFKYAEGGFIAEGRGVFEFGVLLKGVIEPLGWEACAVKGMEDVWRVFAKGIGRGRPGEAERGGESEKCVDILALGTQAA